MARTNADVANAFRELADYLEIQGENPFKVRAYRNAVRALEGLTQPVAEIAARGELDGIPGFGEAIRNKTQDILATGTTKLLTQAREKVPATLLEFLELPGVGTKTIHQLWQSHQIETIDALREAALAGKIRDWPGMGEKTEAKLLDAIARREKYGQRILLSDARRLATSLVTALSDRPEVATIAYAGSARRGVETVGDLDLVGASRDCAATMAAFVALPQIASVISRGERSTRVTLASGISCDLKLVPPGDFGMLLHHFTGSRAHNIKLRDIAEHQGLKINEYGVFRGDMELPLGDDENEVYRALGLPPIPVPLRENRGEIEAAQSGRLPTLIQQSDIRGDLHAHTKASDGTCSIEEMARAAKTRGYEYLAITDHSRSLTVANGLTPERLRAQIREVRMAEDKIGIRLLTGTEMEIKGDGSLDFDDALLSELDFVIASVHSRFNQSETEMTARMVKAVQNPHVDLIGHPTGRLLNAREPYAINLEALIEAAAKSGTALEINSAPERLDLNDVHARQAKEGGVKIIVNTDAHAPEHYDLMEYGILTAQRAWLEPGDVRNTGSYDDLRAWLDRDRS